MSEDEVVILIFCCIIALIGWVRWYYLTSAAAGFGAARRQRMPLYLIPPICLGFLLLVLKLAASHDVRDSLVYLFFYLTMGAAWLALSTAPLRLMGVSPRDDALERRNPAAAHALGGALLGLTFCFAGANIGDGPGWWVVVFCAAMASATLFFTWAIIQKLGGTSELVAIERDVASGVRLGGFLVAVGLVCGRAAAGDWTSAANAVRDFVHIAWPVLALAAVESVASRLLKPTLQRPEPPVMAFGFVPAAIYVALAAAYVWEVGHWSTALER
jgi:uncharacterized membrane protein YjfL (UPF0719 family)